MADIKVIKHNGRVVNPGVCRCCRSIKKCHILTAEYEFMDTKEVYSDMFMDVFGILLSHLNGDSKDSYICASCVSRLREAYAFKRQVLESEQMFLEARQQNKDGNEQIVKSEIKIEPVCESDIPDVTMDDTFDDYYGNGQIVKSEIKIEPVCESDVPDVTMDNTSDDHFDIDNIKVDMQESTDGSQPKELKKTRHGRKSKLSNELRSKKRLRVKDTLLMTNEHTKNTSKEILDNYQKAYSNTVTIVQNSFVCPFHNRFSMYYCYYCKDQFTNPTELREHTLLHDPKELFEGTTENKKIPKIDITRIDCRLCPKKIDDLETFKRHITSVHDISIYPITNEFLKFRLTLNNLKCTECDSAFPYIDALKKHMIDHFGTFTCDICGTCFLEETSLRTHIKTHSKEDVNFPCEICGKNLKSKYSRKAHVATVHEKKSVVNCYKCEAAFLSYALRNRHLIEVHGDKRTFPCKLCDKVYNRRKTLLEHNRLNHIKVYKHQCDQCDQSFHLPSRLKEHMATHSGERNC